MLELERRQNSKKRTAVGIVHPDGHLIKTIKRQGGQWFETNQEPEIYLAEKLEPVLTRPKRLTAIIGGRGSTKSIGVGDIVLLEAHDEQKNCLCLREFGSSVSDSMHELLKSEIERLEFKGFTPTEKTIQHRLGGKFRFNGLERNPESVKSFFGFLRFWIEEAQFLSKDSLATLTPTARNKPKRGLPMSMEELEKDEIDLDQVQMIFTGNPGHSEDPFSQRFIVPFKDELDKHGIYEDDLHLIIVMNWRDNPWYKQSGLERERIFDLENKTRAEYDWIWEGEFNDSVENGLVMPEWFDACIDAHEKLGFAAKGAKIGSHDPSDTGPDPKGYVSRHGSILTAIEEKIDGDVNEGCDWALALATKDKVNVYSWDAVGMGASLKRQTAEHFRGIPITIGQFSGGEKPDSPTAIFQPLTDEDMVHDQKTNDQVFKNQNAQYAWEVRMRMYKTYEAVKLGKYRDPDELLSIPSSLKNVKKLRAEVCRMPMKPNKNGLIELYTKQELKTKFGIKSPNLFDALKMTLKPYVHIAQNQVRMPQPNKPMGRR